MKQDFQGRLHDLQEDVRRDWQLYLLLAPMLILVCGFLYKPVRIGHRIPGFLDLRGHRKEPLGRFCEFRGALPQRHVRAFFWNTITISGLGLIFAFRCQSFWP
nr:hypothetical protein [Agrobacterium fabrum]